MHKKAYHRRQVWVMSMTLLNITKSGCCNWRETYRHPYHNSGSVHIRRTNKSIITGHTKLYREDQTTWPCIQPGLGLTADWWRLSEACSQFNAYCLFNSAHSFSNALQFLRSYMVSHYGSQVQHCPVLEHETKTLQIKWITVPIRLCAPNCTNWGKILLFSLIPTVWTEMLTLDTTFSNP